MTTREPDPRWSMIVGGLTPEGQVLPMSSTVLESLASEWAATVSNVEAFGGTELLAKARSLFVLSWFDYDVMVDACLAGFQAVEATFRHVAFPDASDRLPFKRLVDRAEQDDLLSADKADVVRAGVELRNQLSHPGGTTTFSLGTAGPMLQIAHLVVRDVCAARGLLTSA